jgi:iron complex outermembrane receptor protein
MRRSTAHAIAAISMLPVAAIGSEDTLTEEIVVTASFTGATDSLEKPIHILSGDDVANAGVQSLGEHIDSLLGVSTADFGAAAGQPIIRGLSGTRVKVLNNGTVIRDVSGLGPDHAIDAPLADLQQIEVVRGPSALMYSNGSVGGVINVVDNTIPVTDLEGFSGFLGGEAQSVNDGEAVDFAARGHLGGLNITYSFQEQDLENYEIPNNAVLEMHEDHDGEEHDGEHDEDHDHDEHRDEHGAMDELANSDYESTAHRLGLSTTGDWGYVGVSYTDLSTTYGIPFHGEHASHEGHGDHGDDHDGDHDEAHEGEEHHDEHGEERIFAETESETVTFRGSVNTSFGWLNSIDFVVKDTDYELSEGHMEAGHDDEHEGEEHEGEEHDDHDEHGPTVFSNESTEIQVALDLSAGERVRRLVFNYAEEEMAIIGEEAFMAPVDSTETTLGFFSSDDLGFATLDLGVRFDRIERDGSLAEMHHEEDHDEHEGEHDEDHEGDHDEEHHDDHHEGEMTFEPQSYKEDAFSIAAMLTREINDDSTLSLGLSSVSKVPSAVELFMNGEHLATNRYELGDITLDTERADSIDLTFSFERNSWYGVASVYHNRIDNYIYLRDELEEEHESHMDDDHDEDHHDEGHHDDEHPDHGSLQLAEYTQRDAEFTGYEIEIGTVIELPRGALQLSLSRDEVDAEFNNGEDVPRIVPARNMFSVQYSLDNFSAKLFVKDVEKQTNVAPGESVTDGFTLVDAFASWSYGLTDSSQLTLSAFARNLTDEAARNHASFVKNDVPLPGRNIGVRVQLSF